MRLRYKVVVEIESDELSPPELASIISLIESGMSPEDALNFMGHDRSTSVTLDEDIPITSYVSQGRKCDTYVTAYNDADEEDFYWDNLNGSTDVLQSEHTPAQIETPSIQEESETRPTEAYIYNGNIIVREYNLNPDVPAYITYSVYVDGGADSRQSIVSENTTAQEPTQPESPQPQEDHNSIIEGVAIPHETEPGKWVIPIGHGEHSGKVINKKYFKYKIKRGHEINN